MVEHTQAAILRSLFTTSEIDSVQNFKRKDRRHPLQRLLFSTESDSAVVRNTEFSLRSIQSTAGPWLETLKPRLLSEKDYNSASGALAEMRAYGYLSLVGAAVQPIFESRSSSTCDFSIEEGGARVIVEVYAKQADASEARAQEEFQNQVPKPLVSDDQIAVRMGVSTPFGRPRGDEGVTLRALYKLLRMKREEENDNKQFSEALTTILWLDFQDETWDLIINEVGTVPVLSWQKQFYSGPIWFAFYGWCGAPVFEHHTCEHRIKMPPPRMPQDGRFRSNTKIDAAIISFPRSTIILDNPYSKKPTQSWLWKRLLLLPWLKYEYSYINWPKDNLKQRIELQRETIEALSEEVVYCW